MIALSASAVPGFLLVNGALAIWVVYLSVGLRRSPARSLPLWTAVASALFALAALVGPVFLFYDPLVASVAAATVLVVGMRTAREALVGIVVAVLATNLMQGASLFRVTNSPYAPAAGAVIGFLLLSLRLSRRAAHSLQNEVELARQNAALREENGLQRFKVEVARELHDQIGHDLTALNVRLQLLARTLGDLDAGTAAECRDIQQHAKKALVDLRHVVEGFNSVDLREQLAGIPQLLRYQAISAHLSIDDSVVEAMGARCRTALYWILLESTTNVLRYSSGKNCWISLGRSGEDPSLARLAIEDDGAGAGGWRGAPRPGRGVEGMRQRAEEVGGQLTLCARQPQGTLVSVQVPLGRAADSSPLEARPAQGDRPPSRKEHI